MRYDELPIEYKGHITASTIEKLLHEQPFLESYIGDPTDYPTDGDTNIGALALKERLFETPITLSSNEIEELRRHVIETPYEKEDFSNIRDIIENEVLVADGVEYHKKPISDAINNTMVKDLLGNSTIVKLYVVDKAGEVSLEELFDDDTIDKVAKCNKRAEEIINTKTALQDELMYIKDMVVMNELYKAFVEE